MESSPGAVLSQESPPAPKRRPAMGLFQVIKGNCPTAYFVLDALTDLSSKEFLSLISRNSTGTDSVPIERPSGRATWQNTKDQHVIDIDLKSFFDQVDQEIDPPEGTLPAR